MRAAFIYLAEICAKWREKMPAPIKSFKSGNFEGSIWQNEKDFGNDGGIVQFKSVSLRKTWRDTSNVLREQKINLRRNDVEKLIVILRKIQEHLILDEKKED